MLNDLILHPFSSFALVLTVVDGDNTHKQYIYNSPSDYLLARITASNLAEDYKTDQKKYDCCQVLDYISIDLGYFPEDKPKTIDNFIPVEYSIFKIDGELNFFKKYENFRVEERLSSPYAHSDVKKILTYIEIYILNKD